MRKAGTNDRDHIALPAALQRLRQLCDLLKPRPAQLVQHGAAAATAVSLLAGGVVPVIYFLKGRGGLLRLGKTSWDGRAMKKACANGSSEFISNISMSLVSMLYNYQLIRYAGEDGVAAYGVLMYVAMIFLAAFIGFSVGTVPVVGFHYGAEHKDEVKGLLRMSLVVVGEFFRADVPRGRGVGASACAAVRRI